MPRHQRSGSSKIPRATVTGGRLTSRKKQPRLTSPSFRSRPDLKRFKSSSFSTSEVRATWRRLWRILEPPLFSLEARVEVLYDHLEGEYLLEGLDRILFRRELTDYLGELYALRSSMDWEEWFVWTVKTVEELLGQSRPMRPVPKSEKRLTFAIEDGSVLYAVSNLVGIHPLKAFRNNASTAFSIARNPNTS